MILKLETPSASSSFLSFPVLSPKPNQKTFHGNQINPKPSISLSLSHHFNRLRKTLTRNINPTTPTNCISRQEEEESQQSWKCLKFVRGKKLLSELSTWGIGGPCNYFVQVFNQTQLVSAIRYCVENSIRFIVVGKGSNCLFDDCGFDGCVILNRIEFLERTEPGIYRVGSGYPFNRLGVQCSNEGFTGLEFAGGIPGTVGGAAYMNAGANGQETADPIDSVEIVTIDGRHQRLYRSDLAFGYRTSPFQEMKDLAAIVAVTFQLKPSASAKERQKAYLGRRRLSQPVGERSAGSVFQNPSGLGISAGELIEKAGLKGYSVGSAKVSDVHANFFINSGDSTSREMLELIDLVKAKVDRKFGIQLKEEIRYVNSYHDGFNAR